MPSSSIVKLMTATVQLHSKDTAYVVVVIGIIKIVTITVTAIIY